MKRTTIFVDEVIERDLKALAASADVPVAALVREALSEYVARRQETAAPPVRFLAAGRSGREDVAELSEEIVFAELEPHGPRGAAPARRKTKR